jgi:hypothetical protein
MDRRKLAAWALILFGVILLSMQLDIITPSRSTLVILVSAFLGIMLFTKGINHPKHKGILGGSFFVLLSATLLFMKIDIFPSDDQLGVAFILFDLAAANFIYYLFQKEFMSNIISGFVFIAIGLIIIIDYYDVIPMWFAIDLLQTYWPVILIIIGVIILTKASVKNKKTIDLT